MNLLSLLGKYLDSDNNSIIINREFCVRLKTPMAGCFECIDRCPDLSIKITDNDINIFENCSYCNACMHICPNSVFHIKNNRALNIENTQIHNDYIHYFCVKTEPYFKIALNQKTSGQINKIKCIYEINDLDIMSFIKNGKKLIFLTEDCQSCKLKYFYRKKIKRVAEIKKFLNMEDSTKEINIKNFNVERFLNKEVARDSRSSIGSILKSKDEIDGSAKVKDKNEIMDRREFFKNSFKGIKNNAKKIIEELSVEDLPLSEFYSDYFYSENKNERKNNKLLIERQKKLYLFLRDNVELLPLLNIRLPKLNANCVFCSNCWELCPTGALTFKENRISLDPFLCTGCNLCRDICSFRAVKMQKAKILKDISKQKVLLSQDTVL